MTERSYNKMVASNTLNANLNIMQSLREKGEQNSVLFVLLYKECQRIVKRYPSLR